MDYEIDQHHVEGDYEHLTFYTDPFNAGYLRRKISTGEIEYTKKFKGETSLQAAGREFTDSIMKAMYG